MSGKIFISYRRSDTAPMANRMFDWLATQFGGEFVFIDNVGIPAGVDFRKHIEEQVRKARVILVVIGKAWLDTLIQRNAEPDDWLRFEIETAFSQQKDVVPVLVDGASMPRSTLLPPSIADLAFRNAATVSTPSDDFRVHMDRIVKLLSKEYGFNRITPTATALEAVAATSNLIVPSGYTGPRQPPPRADEQWQTVALPDIAQEQWANGPGGSDQRPSMAVWAKHCNDLFIRSRSHVVEMTLPKGVVVDCQTEPDPKTILQLLATLLPNKQGTILKGTSGVCAGPASSFLVSDGRTIVEFSRGHCVMAQVSDKFAWDKMTFRSSRHAASKEALVHSNDQGLTFFDVSSRPYRVQSKFDVSLDSRGDLLWSPSLKTLAYYYDATRRVAIVTQSVDGTFNEGSTAFFSDFNFSAPSSIAWHSSRDILAYTGWDSQLHCAMLAAYDFSTGKQVFKRRLKHTNVANKLDWSATGQYIATASPDGTVVIWDLANDEEVTSYDHRGPVDRIEFSPDGQRLATFGKGGVIICHPGTGQTTARWTGSASRESFEESVWAPDASMIVSSNGALEVRQLVA